MRRNVVLSHAPLSMLPNMGITVSLSVNVHIWDLLDKQIQKVFIYLL